MSDPSDYHKVDPKLLDDHTLAQLRDLKQSIEGRIADKLEEGNQVCKLAENIAAELKKEGPVDITVDLRTNIKLVSGYRPYSWNPQKPETHPEVQAFIEEIRTRITAKLTTQRLEAVGLSEDFREEVENGILGCLR